MKTDNNNYYCTVPIRIAYKAVRLFVCIKMIKLTVIVESICISLRLFSKIRRFCRRPGR